MIAKTEIERLRVSVATLPYGSRGFIGVDYQWFDRLLEEHLTMRALVERLATSSPYGASNLDTECEWCGAPRDDEHFETCTWRCAVALFGPAGGERKETANG